MDVCLAVTLYFLVHLVSFKTTGSVRVSGVTYHMPLLAQLHKGNVVV